MTAGVLGAAFTLQHVPDLVRYGSKPRREQARLPELLGALRTYEQALAYPPHQVFIGSLRPEELWDLPRPATEENLKQAKAYVDSLQAGGGTEMMAGLRRALAASHDPSHTQIYVFMTDGFISEETEIMKVVKEERGNARFFAVGPGENVNRGLLDGIGTFGKGATIYALPSDETAVPSTISTLSTLVKSTWLSEAKIDWGGLPVFDVYPSDFPDLYAGQVAAISGRYKGSGSGTITITGKANGQTVRIPIKVTLPESEPRHEALASIWARRCVEELSSRHLSAPMWQKQAIEGSIVRLACDFQLVTRWTAFVAVDERLSPTGRAMFEPADLKTEPSKVRVRVPAWGMKLEVGENGQLTVVDANSLTGVRVGSILKKVNGIEIANLGHLESVLLQVPGKSVRVAFDSTTSTLPKP